MSRLRALLVPVLAWLALLAWEPGAAAAAARSRPGAPARPAPANAAVRRAHAAADTTARAPRAGPRTLDEIRIEGEIPVPQVLFITAREQRRFMEFQHHRYQRTSLELGRATPTPTRLVVPAPAPVERKENPR